MASHTLCLRKGKIASCLPPGFHIEFVSIYLDILCDYGAILDFMVICGCQWFFVFFKHMCMDVAVCV